MGSCEGLRNSLCLTWSSAVSIAMLLIVAHPGMRQVLLLHPLSTPCARLELLWPALCTGAVFIKRWLTTVVSTNVEPESSKKQRTGFLCVDPSTPRHHVDRDKKGQLVVFKRDGGKFYIAQVSNRSCSLQFTALPWQTRSSHGQLNLLTRKLRIDTSSFLFFNE